MCLLVFIFGLGFGAKASAATLFSDDFNDNSIDASKWVEVEYLSQNNITETGGKINLNGSGGAWGRTALFSQTNFTRAANTTFIATVNISASTPNLMYGFKDSDASYSYTNMVYGLYFRKDNVSGNNILGTWENGAGSKITEVPYSLNTNYKIAIVLKPLGAKYYIQGGAFGTFGGDQWTLLYDSSYLNENNLKVGFTVNNVGGQIMTMDDVSVVDNGINDVYGALSIQNIMVAKPTLTSVTLETITDINSDITVNYGLSSSYGSSVTSSDQTIHKVDISGLNPGATYHYQITAAEVGYPSRIQTTADATFKIQAPVGTNFTFATISDMQHGNWSAVASQIQTLNPDLMLFPGDSIWGENTTNEANYFNQWQEDVFNYSQNLTNHIPSYWTMGNHDFIGYMHTQDTPGSYSAFAQILDLPIPAENTENYYSFDYGDVHFAVINASQCTVNVANRTWLDADLAETTKKWKVVLMHMPNINPSGVSNILACNPTPAAALQSIFQNRGVQLVINGHSHVYHRWIKDGIFYVTNPAASAALWPVFNDSTGDAGSLGSSISTLGYTVGTVTPSQLTISAYNSSGVLQDTFNIAPNTFDVSSPATNSYTASASPTLTWNATTQTDAYANPPLALSKYQLYVDGSLNRDSIPTGTTSTTPTSALADGAHTWYIKAVNNAGWNTQSTSTYTINVDGTPPAVTSSTNPKFHTDTTSVMLSLATDENSTCKYSTSQSDAYADMTTFTNSGEKNHSTLIDNLSPGDYNYYAICRDTVGNDTSYTLTFQIAQRENDTETSDAKLNIDQNSQTLDEDKKIYFDQDEAKLKGQDTTIASGTVKIYKEGKRYATVDVDANGNWSKKLTFKHNKTYTLKLKFYDQYGTFRDEKEYEVKVDTEKPIFTDPFSQTLTIQKDDKINFEATDNETGIDYYKVNLLDPKGHILRAWRKQNQSFYLIPENIFNQADIILVRAYDKAGNYAEEQTIINFENLTDTSIETPALLVETPNLGVSTETNGTNFKPNICNYTVQAGDMLWRIAEQVYGDAKAYPLIIEKNKDKYPNIASGLLIGQELTFCDNNQNSQMTGNNSNADNSLPTGQAGSQQNQTQPQSESQPSTFKWWNPFSWF